MSPHDPHHALWTELNALVDGELTPNRLADAAARIADDPDAARTFAALAALKAATAEMNSRPRDLPPPASARSAQRSVAIAAALILGVGLGAVLSLPGQPPLPASLLVPAALGLADDVLIGGLRLPNLEMGNLRLVQVTTSERPTPAVQASYVGERGCQLNLTVTRSDEAESLPENDHQAASWRAGPYRYTMTSTRMDPRRFAAVVQIAQAATRPAASARIADAADLTNRPCLG